MAQHTPGPWAIEEGCATSIWSGGQYVAETYADGEANARLIAAAPDLLAALKSAHETLLDLAKDVGGAAWLTDPLHADHGPLARIEAAIAKAEGQS